MKPWPAIATTFDDGINPIAVKELRQGVQGGGVIAILFLFLLVNLAIVGGYVMLSTDAETSITGGRDIFVGLLGILQFTCMLLVPLYTGGRMSRERAAVDLDLLYITTLSPGAIVRGKYVSATALTLLIFSASMPFMILTYLFRGIDLPTIFFAIATSFLTCSIANAVGIAVGCIPSKGALRSFGYVSFFLVLPMFPVIMSSMRLSVRSGVGSWLGTWEFWAVAGTCILLALLAIGLMYVLSVALLSPKTSNRMLVPRIYLTIAWVLIGIVMGAWSYSEKAWEPMATWMLGSCIALIVLTVMAFGERDAWSIRVRRHIPRSRLLRPLAFLFYTGSAGGVLWCALLFAATIVITLSLHSIWTWLLGTPDIRIMCVTMTVIYGYVLCYCLTVAAGRPLLYPHVPTYYLPIMALLLGVAVELVPYLTAFFLERNWWVVLPWYSIASPMVLGMDNNLEAKYVAYVFVSGWFVIAVLISMPWALGQWMRFKPHRSGSAPLVENGESITQPSP